ncbi:MAG: type III toxin-antitoxin system ToxN/AbiQ family toxin [Firmicutes bacterium]|nr:type III toxin-antitoxin system ToxN/AbiQ family toxin [Bacillota bacterium]
MEIVYPHDEYIDWLRHADYNVYKNQGERPYIELPKFAGHDYIGPLSKSNYNLKRSLRPGVLPLDGGKLGYLVLMAQIPIIGQQNCDPLDWDLVDDDEYELLSRQFDWFAKDKNINRVRDKTFAFREQYRRKQLPIETKRRSVNFGVVENQAKLFPKKLLTNDTMQRIV